MLASLDSLSFSYQDDQPIFADFSWQVKAGERWAVLGPSGCGKSTLLLLLAGILLPDRGEIQVNGKRLERPRPRTGLILQDYGLLPWATVEKNVSLGLRLHKFYGPDEIHASLETIVNDYQAVVDTWLNRLGLEGVRDSYPAQISGGQQQRTAIARTLTLNPNLLLMDEPLGSLDSPTAAALQDLLIDLNQEDGLAMVLVTHSVETAAFLGQKILILGQPPNTKPRVLVNPGSGTAHYRESNPYLKLCETLRGELEASL